MGLFLSEAELLFDFNTFFTGLSPCLIYKANLTTEGRVLEMIKGLQNQGSLQLRMIGYTKMMTHHKRERQGSRWLSSFGYI